MTNTGSTDGAKTWARIASLIGTCRLNGVSPFDGLTRPHCGHGPISPYIAATFRKILDQHMQSDVAALMPRNFRE